MGSPPDNLSCGADFLKNLVQILKNLGPIYFKVATRRKSCIFIHVEPHKHTTTKIVRCK